MYPMFIGKTTKTFYYIETMSYINRNLTNYPLSRVLHTICH